MQGFMITFLTCSVTMSAIALFYMAITPVLAKRYQVKWRYYAWLVIVIGLFIPFRPNFNHAIITVDVPGTMPIPISQIGNETTIIPFDENVALSTNSLPNFSMWQAIVIIWTAGAIIFLVYHSIKHYRFIKMAARWSEAVIDKQTLALFQDLKSEMGISKNIDLQICLSIGSPMLFGLVNPRILLPRKDLAEDELCFILKHELVHYKRKDLWYKCLVLAATAIHWFNPIVYLMAKAINMQCELSCDDVVVQGANNYKRQQYSETIIGVVKFQSKQKTSLSTNYLGGKKGMKKRIFSIMDTTHKKTSIIVLCVTIIAVMVSGLLVACNVSEAQNDTPIETNSQDEIQSPATTSTPDVTPESNPNSETEADTKLKAAADFLISPDGVNFQATAYKAAKTFLNGDLEELTEYITESCEVDEELDLFKDIDYMVLKWHPDNIKSENEINTSYQFLLKGEDSASYVSMELIKVDSEWKVNSIALEK